MLHTPRECKTLIGSFVYALCDEIGREFYVGQTRRLGRRISEHRWRPTKSTNPATRRMIVALGDNLRISILRDNPQDINAAEREEIAKRPWLLNSIGPHHWAWSQRTDKPWHVGTGIKTPSSIFVDHVSDDVGRGLRRYLRSLGRIERALLELRLFEALPPSAMGLGQKWLRLALPKLRQVVSGCAV